MCNVSYGCAELWMYMLDLIMKKLCWLSVRIVLLSNADATKLDYDICSVRMRTWSIYIFVFQSPCIRGVQKKIHASVTSTQNQWPAVRQHPCHSKLKKKRRQALGGVRFWNLSSLASYAEAELKCPHQRQQRSETKPQEVELKLHAWTQKRNCGWDAQRPGKKKPKLTKPQVASTYSLPRCVYMWCVRRQHSSSSSCCGWARKYPLRIPLSWVIGSRSIWTKRRAAVLVSRVYFLCRCRWRATPGERRSLTEGLQCFWLVQYSYIIIWEQMVESHHTCGLSIRLQYIYRRPSHA